MDAKHLQVIFTKYIMRKIFGHRDGKNFDGSSTKVKNLPEVSIKILPMRHMKSSLQLLTPELPFLTFWRIY